MQFKINLIFVINYLLLFVCGGVHNVFAGNTEFFSSVHQMSKLVQLESVLLQQMQKYIKINENKLDFLKDRLAMLERDNREALEEGLNYFDSPLNKYYLTKRLTVDWARIENIMQHESGKKTLNRIAKYESTNHYPENSELDGAIAGFLRIQEVYRLKTADMAQGILDGVKYNISLDARLCLDIAKYAAKENNMRFTHSWALEALKRLQDPAEVSNNPTAVLAEKLEVAEILELLATSKKNLGDLKGANQTYAELVQLRPDIENYTREYLVFLKENVHKEYVSVDLSDEHEPLPADLHSTDQFTRYKHTCNGLLKQSPSEERELRCGYLTETDPFLLLAPLKAEELNHHPLLVLYHDVLSDAEIEIMKGLSDNRIVRATVAGINGSVVSELRTSQFVFMPRTAHKLLEAIDVRAEQMTDLNMEYSEDHQFQNYGIGGHYGQHYDWFQSEDLLISSREMGNRIATVLFYLTDVEQGGGTAFPFLKRLLMPKKGDAAFWYNLHADGVGDLRNLHGGCPIIVGSKWVLNRWIRENIQSDRRPCELWPDSCRDCA
ncbi:unnamed protein product [Ceratitis capitata]|uniref:procollagen-proline 4-dioxygenase n=1 Tax=Ceratitis capitata TaxID=7213 RepID=A0A811U1V7_CERCA|nr:unnamed protein product [Ceratitis capitata]